MARLGNLFKAWLEYGPGVFEGKGTEALRIHRGAMGVERLSVRDILDSLKVVAERMKAAMGEDP